MWIRAKNSDGSETSINMDNVDYYSFDRSKNLLKIKFSGGNEIEILSQDPDIIGCFLDESYSLLDLEEETSSIDEKVAKKKHKKCVDKSESSLDDIPF